LISRQDSWPQEVTKSHEKVALADRIIARLTKSINTLRANNATRHVSRVQEAGVAYGSSGGEAVEDITDEEIELLLRVE